MQQQQRTLILGSDQLLTNGLVNRLGISNVLVLEENGDEESPPLNISSIVLTSAQLSSDHERFLNRILKQQQQPQNQEDTNSSNSKQHGKIVIVRVVPALQDSPAHLRHSTSKDIIDQIITIHTPLFYEDLLANRDSFFIHNVETATPANQQNIVKYYGDAELRIPLISREDLLTCIVTIILKSDFITNYLPTNITVRGDLIRLESIVMSLYGREFQYENVVNGRPGEERYAFRFSQWVRRFENMSSSSLISSSSLDGSNNSIKVPSLLRWTEFLTH